jgi:hypothetical protein
VWAARLKRTSRRQDSSRSEPKSVGVRWTIVVLVVAAMAFAGCGRADDDRAVRTVTTRFLEAVEDGDGSRACTLLSPGAVEALEHDESAPCQRAAPELELQPGAVIRTQVFATEAKVDLDGGESAFLELTSSGWRLSAAGCTPSGPDEPYECELEA